jgi:Flp pilus assembly protein TadG
VRGGSCSPTPPPAPAPPPTSVPPNRDAGTATIEFVGVTLLLLLPLLYLLLSVFSVQRAAFAVTQAAREAGRAYSTAPTAATGQERALYAARLAMHDQGVADRTTVRFAPEGSSCGSSSSGSSSADGAASLQPGARFVVCVHSSAPLPAGGVSIPVNGQFTVSVDAFRRAR